jgi:hypothetical protein
MSQPTNAARQIPVKLWRKAVWPPMGVGLMMILFGWVAYVACRFFQYDLLSSDHAVRDDSSGALRLTFYFCMAVFFTFLGTVVAGLIARSNLYIYDSPRHQGCRPYRRACEHGLQGREEDRD